MQELVDLVSQKAANIGEAFSATAKLEAFLDRFDDKKLEKELAEGKLTPTSVANINVDDISSADARELEKMVKRLVSEMIREYNNQTDPTRRKVGEGEVIVEEEESFHPEDWESVDDDDDLLDELNEALAEEEERDKYGLWEMVTNELKKHPEKKDESAVIKEKVESESESDTDTTTTENDDDDEEDEDEEEENILDTEPEKEPPQKPAPAKFAFEDQSCHECHEKIDHDNLKTMIFQNKKPTLVHFCCIKCFENFELPKK